MRTPNMSEMDFKEIYHLFENLSEKLVGKKDSSMLCIYFCSFIVHSYEMCDANNTI